MELKNCIKEFEKKIDVGEMEKEIKKYRQEERTLKGKLRFLSLNGAVLLPLTFLLLALFFSFWGMSIYQWDPNKSNNYVVVSLLANASGFGFLLKVLETVEWAARRVPLPKFEVYFRSWLKEEKMMIKEQRELQVEIFNNGDIMAEDLEVFVFFPPDFKVKSGLGYNVVTQTERDDYPACTAAIFKKDKIHVNIHNYSPKIVVEAPEKPSKYKIPVCIYERNTGECEYEFSLEVVD